MAGWIKVESDTADKREVMILSRLLNIDRDAAFGKLIRVWGWFDKNSTDGCVSGFVDADIDAFVGLAGFSEGMRAVGWLADTEAGDGLMLPHFERHNAETGKSRALKNARQARWRAGVAARAAARIAGETPTVTPTPSQNDASSGLPEREKNRERDPLSLTAPAPAVLPAVVEAYVRKFGVPPTNGGLAQLEKITDLGAWREVLDYWAANGHRIQSIGGMVNRYHEQVRLRDRMAARKENEIASSRGRAARTNGSTASLERIIRETRSLHIGDPDYGLEDLISDVVYRAGRAGLRTDRATIERVLRPDSLPLLPLVAASGG